MRLKIYQAIIVFAIIEAATPVDVAVNPVNAAVDKFITVIELLYAMASYNCDVSKTVFGISYYQIDNTVNEPTADNLAMVLYSVNNGVIEKKYFRFSDPISLLLNDPKFKPDLPITIHMHGYTNDQNTGNVVDITNALLTRGTSNVLTVDPGNLIFKNYQKSTSHVIFIGELLGRWLVNYYNMGGPNRLKIHLIGFSLGAHISGHAGKVFQAMAGVRLPRITGLDPAGPCYYSQSSSHTLWNTDADFVDVIHSDAGIIGINKALGHVDYYPNNGKNQPGGLIPPESHDRSWKIFAESMYFPTNFPAVPCANWASFLSGACSFLPKVYMGYDVPHTTRGIYYSRTNSAPYYGMGDQGARQDDNPWKAFTAWFLALLFGSLF